MSHHFPSYIRNQEKAQWRTIFSGDDLEGRTLCIIGAGSIGTEIGKKAKAFDMRVIGLKRHPEPLESFDEVWGIDRLDEALPLSDYVVLITPLTPETHHLMGAEEFRAMKDTAVFINVSRGDTVDEQALISALEQKEIAGAVLDVFHTEPLPKESPLWAMENVMVTPHNAGPSTNSEQKTIRLLSDNIARFRNGRELINKIGQLY
jgi:phosphoglycerate dehydrogenase-like enzyme